MFNLKSIEMKKIYFLIAITFAGFSLNAQTLGSLNFTVTTTSTGNYSPKHVLAIWIEKADGTFVKTNLKKANARVQWLNQWVAKSGSNVVDAVTGSTINTHQTESITWNATDVNGSVVADGDYKLWVQMAWANSNGPTFSIPFTKGANSVHLTPANQTNYLNMVLDWTPNTTGISENLKQTLFSVFPNPFNNKTAINYTLNSITDVSICLYDISGKLVKLLVNQNQNAGSYSLPINADGELKAGNYILKMNTGKSFYSEKILILE